MLVCVCKGISCRDVDAAMQGGAATVKDLSRQLKLGICCGQCMTFTRDLMAEKLLARDATENMHLAQAVAV